MFGDKTTNEAKATLSLTGTSGLAVDDSATSSASQVTLAATADGKSQIDIAKEGDNKQGDKNAM